MLKNWNYARLKNQSRLLNIRFKKRFKKFITKLVLEKYQVKSNQNYIKKNDNFTETS